MLCMEGDATLSARAVERRDDCDRRRLPRTRRVCYRRSRRLVHADVEPIRRGEHPGRVIADLLGVGLGRVG